MADDIVVGSVAVDIVPDTRNFRRDLNAKLQGITVDIGVRADTAGVRAELDDVARHRDATITANADVAEANAQLDITARDRTSTIRANVDKSQVSAVGKLSGALGNIGVLGTSIITLGPALIPILAVVAGIGLALGAPIAVAAGGATVFGFLAGFAVKDTNAQLKAIDKAATKLGTLKKGTAAYAAAQADLRAKQDALTPAQKKYADSLDHIKASFGDLLGGKVGNQLLGPISAFLDLAATVLPKLTPIIGAVSGALTDLLGGLGDAVKSPGFENFVATFSKQVGPDIVAFGHIAGGAIKGFTGLVLGLGDAFGPGVLKGLQGLTDNFANFGQQVGNSKKLQDFVGYFQRVGPQVADTIGAVAKAVGHVVTALAPLGPPALKVVEGIANAISGIPIPVLTALAASFVAMTAAAKISKGFSAIGLLGGGNGLSGKAGIVGRLVGATKPIPVFVVNEGFGGGTGGGGLIGDAKKGIPLLGGLSAGTAAAWAAAGAAVGLASAKGFQLSHKNALLDGPFGLNTLADKIGTGALHIGPKTAAPPSTFSADALLGPLQLNSLTSTTKRIDTLRSSLDKASNGFDIVGHSAHRNFGNIQTDARALQTRLDAIQDKKIRIILQDQAAIRSMQALQAFRFRDKTVTINERERIVGPGGGIGHPLPPANTPSPGSSRGSGGGGPLVNIEHAHVADTNDIMRKSQDALIAQGGGGVTLRPPRTPAFG